MLIGDRKHDPRGTKQLTSLPCYRNHVHESHQKSLAFEPHKHAVLDTGDDL